MITINRLATLALMLLSMLAFTGPSQSESSQVKKNRSLINKSLVNRGTIGIITGGFSSTPLHIATDLANVLDDRYHELRVLPIPGKGGVHNVRDLLFLKGIDLAIINADVLDLINKNNIFLDVKQRVKYITKLYDAELHVVAHKSFSNIRQLQGERVNFALQGSSSDLTGRKMFQIKGVKIQPTYFDEELALEKIQKGEIAAAVIMSGKPNRLLRSVRKNQNLKLLPIKYEAESMRQYLPAKLSAKDYPGLIEDGQNVSTIATSVIIAAYNWPADHKRYKKVSKFVDAFFSNISKLHNRSRHVKWQDVNLTAKVRGWKRFGAATTWLNKQNKPKRRRVASNKWSEKKTVREKQRVIEHKTQVKKAVQLGYFKHVDPLVGYWKSRSADVVVKIYECGGAMCALRLEKGNRPKKVLSRNIRKVSEKTYKGTLLDSRSDLQYKGAVHLISANKMRLRGCAVVVHCNSDIWTRIGAVSSN